MAKDSASRRAWIKNAAIIFLVILLLLTFFSNTILNYSLPEVSAQYAQYGTLSTAIKVSGTVKANASYNVVYEADAAEADDGVVQSRKVLSVYVKEGDTVEKDAPILELKGGASEQLKAAKDEYDKLKRDYDSGILSDIVTNLKSDQTISEAEKAITDAKDELAKLQKNYNDLISGVDTTTIIKEQISTLEDTIETLTEQQNELNNKISEVNTIISKAEALIEDDVLSTLSISEKLAIAKEDYEIAESSYSTLKKEVDFCKERLDEIKSISGDIGEANTLTQTLKTLQNSLDKLIKERDRYIEDNNIDLTNLEIACLNAKAKLKKFIVDNNVDEDNIDEWLQNADADKQEAYSSLLSDVNKAQENYNNYINDINKGVEYERRLEDYAEQIEDLEDQIDEVKSKLKVIGMPEVDDVLDYTVDYDLAAAQKNYDEASAKLAEVEKTYTEAKTKYESLTKQSTAEGTVSEYQTLLATYKDELKSLTDEIKQKNKDLEALNKKLADSTTTLTPEGLLEEIKKQKDAISSLEAALKITEATENQSTTTTKLTREDQKKQLEELEAKIKTYENAPETTAVTAPIAGRIVSINVAAGETVTSGNTVASIEIADKGYICEISMTADQARKVQVGSPCTVVNSWWYSNIEASVTGMRSDPQSQGKNRIITITVKGDVYEGQSLNFSIGDKSQSYDSVLPNSAIREDNDGKFVLVVESKKTPLNVRYTAKRVDVEVLASDDTQSAVSGLYGSEFVITNSTVPISDKQQVRLAEN